MVDAPEMRLRELLKDIARNREYLYKEIELKPICTGGANYTSQLFTTTLSTPGKKDLQLFSKVATLGQKLRSMTTLSVYEIEIRFYTEILPTYRKLEETYKIPVEERLILPEYYGGNTECFKELVVLEDLSAKEYITKHRYECFDWKYSSSSISALARFHALSVAFEKSDPVAYSAMVDHLKFSYPADQDYLNNGLLAAVKAVDEKYRDRVKDFLQDDLKKNTLMKFWGPAQRRLVLCHGDFRPSNILHKTDKDGNVRIAMVDHQLIRRGNPVADLMFFLICGSDEQFRANHLYQFFDHYYEMFSKALRRFNIDSNDIYLETDYRSDVQQFLRFGLTLGVYSLLHITVDEEKAPKPEEGIEVENLIVEVGARFRDRFNGLVKTYMQLGIL